MSRKQAAIKQTCLCMADGKAIGRIRYLWAPPANRFEGRPTEKALEQSQAASAAKPSRAQIQHVACVRNHVGAGCR